MMILTLRCQEQPWWERGRGRGGLADTGKRGWSRRPRMALHGQTPRSPGPKPCPPPGVITAADGEAASRASFTGMGCSLAGVTAGRWSTGPRWEETRTGRTGARGDRASAAPTVLCLGAGSPNFQAESWGAGRWGGLRAGPSAQRGHQVTTHLVA